LSEEFEENETLEDYTIKEYFVTPEVPEPTLKTLQLKIATLSNDVQSYHSEVSDLLEDIKSLGREMLKNQTALDEQLNKINCAFVGNTAELSDLRNELRGTPKSRFVEPQPQRKIEQKEQFDPADLMQHSWKKGKKRNDGSYDVGSLAYGWDFATNFKPETIAELTMQGTIEIAGYEISINKDCKFVSSRSKKK